MSAESAKETLLRDISVSDIMPVFLYGYRRTWTLKEQVVSDTLNKEITAVFLDIEASSQAQMNGILIEVNPVEMERLKLREKNYDCIDVTSSVVAYRNDNHFFSDVFTFISKQNNKVTDKDENLYILKEYVEKVEKACATLGSDFLNLYIKTTQKPLFTLIDGSYSFVSDNQ